MSHNLQHRLQGRRLFAAALLFSTLLSALGAASGYLSAAQPPAGLATGSLRAPAGSFAPAPCEVRVELGRKGRQRLVLAARLEENGGLIHLPVSWTIRRVSASSGRAGEIVYSAFLPRADLPLEAGEYEVDIRYGYRHARQRIRVLSGQYVYMTFILDVGGVRAMSVLENIGPAREVRAEQKIYALNGRGKGRLVAVWRQPGKILRLAAGDYRIESRFLPGNARAHTRVRVKPGVLSTLKIIARAGLVRIRPAGGEAASWELRDAGGLWRKTGARAASLVLAPGEYVLRARLKTRETTRRFVIRAGEEREIFLAGDVR